MWVKKMVSFRQKRQKFGFVLNRKTFEHVGEVADEADVTKSEVVQTILEDVLEDPKRLDELFGPIEEEEEARVDEETEEEEESS